MFLDRLAYLDGKPRGDKSMPGKRWPSGGVQGGVPQDPRDTAKAGLLQAQSPAVKVRTHRNDACNRCRAMPGHEPVGRGNLHGAERRPARAVKGMSGRPTSRCHVRRRRTTGSPTGRESYGDGVPVVVAGVTACQGVRESRTQGEGAQVITTSSDGRYA
jgi:hypothetical protein